MFNVNIPAGTTSRFFPVNIIDDNLLEGTERFRLNIIRTNSTVVTTGSLRETTVSILDDEGSA